ncbi:hypothetical protein J5N97_019390 [Dioscorea zingiberensis]|uniref:ABC transporter domain-containing protein n=1 Tax=Dioscorea zingiberensis TaxID=325984 RepID=A0A9D5HC92_9LILI|nr:hypothetical protein J5N97_019390 [Dioscorea zingiberensis]
MEEFLFALPGMPDILRNCDEDDLARLQAALKKLPTKKRLYTSFLKELSKENNDGNRSIWEHREVDVRKLKAFERQEFIRRNFKITVEDNERFLKKLRNRMGRAGVKLPNVEIRFENLNVEAKCYTGDRALPTLLNSAKNIAESIVSLVGVRFTEMSDITILKDVSGIIKPSRMTLLLGPPSSGKTTILRALAGRLDPSLKVRGEITYNGHMLKEFVPLKTAVYISQNDLHMPELTVRETFDFSARFQGVGVRHELLTKLEKEEKKLGIDSEFEEDLFMKATAARGIRNGLQTDYIIKILGLENCADTIVGNEMLRGLSGGEKKRVTLGEMIVGPARVMFMDEISTGLDSSTTFQIVKCLQQIVHLGEATIFMSLLQPDPETFDLFDDIILLSDGQIVYHGPREDVLAFFESCGFRCPVRKGVADFLQEVTSKKDQEQYWDKSERYCYVSVSEFAAKFKRFHVGLHLESELSVPFDKSISHKAALSFSKNSLSLSELLRTTFAKEWLLMKRNSFVHIFKATQLVIVAVITSTLYPRPRMQSRSEEDGSIFIGALLFGMITNLFSGFAELAYTLDRLPVLHKHRDLLFHPPWTFTLPNFILRSPLCLLESIVWVGITYYSIGFTPQPSSFFKQMLLIFMIQQMAVGIFRLTAGICRSMVISIPGGALALVSVVTLGGFLIPRESIPKWLIWGYWSSPATYAYNGLAVNEMLSPRWMSKLAPDGRRLGVAVLENFDIFPNANWYWIGAGALLAFSILFNLLFTLSLTYLNPLGKPQAVKSDGVEKKMKTSKNNSKAALLSRPNRVNEEEICDSHSLSSGLEFTAEEVTGSKSKRGMVLPFTPLSMSFDEVNYYVDVPAEMKQLGVTEDRLQLLRGVTGAFRPGILTALMGVSGAGKTTLMDVLAGRKTGGYIEGDVRVSGYPKNQSTFARISGYCEQNDVHSPQVTVKESLIFSAFLRLPQELSKEEKMKFVSEVMELVELDGLKDFIVGLPGVTGLSLEQRKRLTIAVELVANPSIIFMDEPTSGLDARAASIVMRTVRNTVNTGRTIVCTIHQPSIDIFESFDELLLMKRGGQIIFFGPLGQNSNKLIGYFEEIPGVPKIREKYNPATWMIEASSTATETRLGIDFAEHYKSSALFQRNKELVSELSKPAPGTNDLHFSTTYSQSSFEQFKYCFWKQWWSYWRNPDYNLTRLIFTLVIALIFGAIFWRIGAKRESSNDLQIAIGCMFYAQLVLGVGYSSIVLPIISTERTVFYRERASGMYSALPYAIAQVVVEIPYVLIQAIIYSFIVYSGMGFQWKTAKFLWFFFSTFFTFLYFTYYGMMMASITPNEQAASILSSFFYTLFNLFSGFYIPRPRIPKWWVWYYWICPLAWTTYGLIVSQYGDLEDMIKVPGQPNQTIKQYIKDHYGYDADFMGIVALVLVGFTVSFAFIFAFSIGKLNFQQR